MMLMNDEGDNHTDDAAADNEDQCGDGNIHADGNPHIINASVIKVTVINACDRLHHMLYFLADV